MKLLMENWREYLDDDFDFLCESHNKGIISDERLVQLWEDNANREYEQLLNEGVMDILAIGYEKGKQLIGKAKATYDAAVKKISDFYLKMCLQAYKLLENIKVGLSKVASVLKGVYQKAQALCQKHPIICKVVKILLAMIAVAAVMAMFSSSAEAAVQVVHPTTGEPMVLNDTGIDAIKGALQIANEGRDPEVQQVYVDAFNWLEQAHAAETIHDISTANQKGAKICNGAFKIMTDIIKEDPTASIQGFSNIGKDVVIQSHEVTQEFFATGKGIERTHIEWQSLTTAR